MGNEYTCAQVKNEMRSKILLVVGIIIWGVLASFCLGSYLETRQVGWIPLRTAVDANDTALDCNTTGYTFAPADRPAKAVPLDPGMNGVDVYIYGTDANDETVNYKIYCYKETGPALLWCYGVATLGSAITGATNTFYADTITTTDVHGDIEVIDSGTDRICVLRLGDMRGIKYVYFEVDLGTAASASAMITGY